MGELLGSCVARAEIGKAIETTRGHALPAAHCMLLLGNLEVVGARP